MSLPTNAKSRSRSRSIHCCLLASLVPGVLVLVAALCDAGRAPAIETAPPPRSAAGEPFDILYLSDVRPVVMRLYVSRDGKPIQAEWERFADAAFALLDRNNNGVIDDVEAADLQPMLALLTSQPNRAFPAAKAMNRANFGDYLRKNGFGPLRINSLIEQNQNRGIRRGGMPSKEELDKLLMELLDTDKDGKISTAEFAAGVEILSRLDLDENELISVDEITRRPLAPFFFAVNDNQPPPSPGVELFPLVRKGPDSSLARSLLVRYGPKPPGAESGPVEPGPRRGRMQAQMEPTAKRLTKKDLKLNDAAFDALDQDGDGELDSEELARFGQAAKPEVEFTIRLGKAREGAKAAEVLRKGEPPVKATCPSGAEVAIESPGIRLDFLPVNSSPRLALRPNLLRRFKRVDSDGNGYLDRMEAANDPLFQRLFDYLDRDRDGRVFEKELIAALDELEPVAAAAASGLLTIELNEAGTGLFGLIDADGDGRLSLTELRAMPRLVERFAADKEKGLSPADVPRRFEATVSLGGGFGPQRRSPRMDAFSGPPRPQVGPAWFQKMDRNRDGFVSRSEFLGTDEEFRKLDLDGDGLISVQEAEAAEKK